MKLEATLKFFTYSAPTKKGQENYFSDFVKMTSTQRALIFLKEILKVTLLE